ncbi:hypothetical protein [Dyadobacter sandarakinus]|uniref:Uncharacterized protein n=1 Tax=Dyadobacter sandarakinus TaxID=2747268 RepID=A0ABX7I3V6_9BACT|nr:hypothetical protein [Dyadobacter sandarakinus]QRR00605.1 hypothetical protein HWI92_06635 [Dyadobacter sandarakinus]
MTASTDRQRADVCLQGYGIVCGLTVQVNANCDVQLGGGTAIVRDGTVITAAKQAYSYYLKEPDAEIQAYFPHQWDEQKRVNRTVLQLVPAGHFDGRLMDSLKQQNPRDLPTRNLLDDKIAVMLVSKADSARRWFLLVSPAVLAEKDGTLQQALKKPVSAEAGTVGRGIFGRPGAGKPVLSAETILRAQYPHLQLKKPVLPRFGYKQLAIADPGQPFGTDNFTNPFSRITLFKDIFGEYKAILDDFIPEFCEALEKLHELYAAVLTHKGEPYLARYRRLLAEKWQVFLAEGECLFYIQYFYDWLSDLVKAYEELCSKLVTLQSECLCDGGTNDQKDVYWLLRLGPVLGGRSSYAPVIFRDYFKPAPINGAQADQENEARFLHWRLLMMIWTFDLPQLRLDQKVLVKGRYIIPAQEFADAQDFFEEQDSDRNGVTDLEDLPLKLTPGQTPDQPLDRQAIPYYYPLDADSPYSLHNFWNYGAMLRAETRYLKSYNAFDGEDSYSHLKSTLFPLAFSLRNDPYVRAEGHIGKKALIDQAAGTVTPDWTPIAEKYNIATGFVCMPVSQLKTWLAQQTARLAVSAGAPYTVSSVVAAVEHSGGFEQGQVLVMVYVDAAGGEQIELSECKKDEAPEVPQFAIVADFTMPATANLKS